MAGSNIFIIYADTSANVTLSPRLGKGNFEPDADDSGQATLLGGSGVSGGKMTANVRCSKCSSWSGGKMSLTDSSSQWIWAVKSGSFKSDSVSAQLPQHDGQGSFSLDLAKARGGNSDNPFVESAANGSTSSEGPAAGSSSSSSGDGDPGAYSGGDVNYAQVAAQFAKRNKAVIAHGTIMGLAFALLFPSGAILIRVLSFPGLVWVHAGLQILAYALAIAGMGLGIYIAIWPSQVHYIDSYHPIIGLVVVCLLAFQPILGLVHHYLYKKQHIRTFWATAHVWFGRVVITLGIINGGLGLKLSANTKRGEIAYGVIAAVLWLVWMAVAGVSYAKRDGSQGRVGESGEKLTGYSRNRGSPDGSQNSYSLEERGTKEQARYR